MSPSATPKASDAATGYLVAGLVLAFSLFMGLFVLPYLGAKSAESSPLVGKPAPDFILPYVSPKERGQKLRLSDLQGRAVLLDFWASWCAPCRAQTPVLERVASTVGKDALLVLGVGTSDEQAAISRFLDNHPHAYASVYDDQGMASSAYHVQGLPTLVLIDREGTVRALASGLVDEAELTRLVRDTLQ